MVSIFFIKIIKKLSLTIIVAFLVILMQLILPKNIHANPGCGWVEDNVICETTSGLSNHDICIEECGGYDMVHGCASVLEDENGVPLGSPNQCVCDDLSPECSELVAGIPYFTGCPKINLNPVCFDAQGGGNILGDIPPYAMCGGLGGSEYECCQNESECTTPTGPCDPDNPAGNSQCDIENGGPCNPCEIESEYPDCDSGTKENYQPRCHINEELNTSYCTCTSNQFFGYDTNNVICDLNPGTGINTAIGCIPVENIGSFVEWILQWTFGIAGGIALILIFYAGILIITSGGNPQKLVAGKELLTAAISGLILLLASSFVLRVIGVDILGIFNI